MDQRDWLRSVLPAEDALDGLLGNDPAAALLGLARTRAPVEFGVAVLDLGDDPALAAEFQLAREAAALLKKNQPVSDAHLKALHALVHLLLRPALRVVGGAIPAIPASWKRLGVAHGIVTRRIRGVGRIDHHDRRHVGTGWFVAKDLLITNRHVAAELCGLKTHSDPDWLTRLPAAVDTTNENWLKHPALRPVWDPDESPGEGHPAPGRIDRIRACHQDLDIALLDVSGVAASAELVLHIRALPPAQIEAHDVYLAGYPGVYPTNQVSKQVAELLFRDATSSGLKRVSPGQLTRLAARLPVATDRPRQEHDGSTLGGSSGSPVIDFDSHQVVAIHYKGTYGVANSAVPFWLLGDDPFFADNGIGFS
jgi:hypothetical protein